MPGKEKQSDSRRDDWQTPLELGQWDANELATARLLHDARPPLQHMAASARQRIRQHLMTHHRHELQRNPIYNALRYAMITAAVATVAGLL